MRVDLVIENAGATCPECHQGVVPDNDAMRKVNCPTCGYPYCGRPEGHADWCTSDREAVAIRLRHALADALLVHLAERHGWPIAQLQAATFEIHGAA